MYKLKPAHLQTAVTLYEKQQLFLPDRHWLYQSDVQQRMAEICETVNQSGWECTSLELYWEWHEKPVLSARMSTADWLIQHAIFQRFYEVLQPHFHPHTAFQRVGMDTLVAAIRQNLTKASFGVALCADIKSFFSNIRHEPLIKQMSKVVPDTFLIAQLKNYLAAIERAKDRVFTQITAAGLPPRQGLPVGVNMSYLLAHFYLTPLDTAIQQAAPAIYYFRYIDDILLWTTNTEQLPQLLQIVERTTTALQLTLHPEKTAIVKDIYELRFLQQNIYQE